MKINYYSFYFLCIWASFCHGKNVNVKKPNSDMMEKAVKTMPTQLGKRVYLDAHYTVHRKDKVVVFVVHANIGNALEQPKLSGSYITLYANKGCFIVGTESPGYTSNVVSNTLNSPKANTACLVWRLLKANEEDRARCRATFAKVCGQYGRYKFVFTKDVCLMKQSINQTLPATKQMN
ncbi:uncharacterized protein [Dermacentor andersoni]|uniref:uncharacterized protein isoform X5 n=1 Tax=Dermacentor andersoni TaxID=34620 RepID=UPI003B3B67F2